MRCKLLLMMNPTDTNPTEVLDIELPEAPPAGENLSHAGRAYKLLQRSWVTEPRTQRSDLNPEVAYWGLHCVYLVGQIAGPPHIKKPGLVGLGGGH